MTRSESRAIKSFILAVILMIVGLSYILGVATYTGAGDSSYPPIHTRYLIYKIASAHIQNSIGRWLCSFLIATAFSAYPITFMGVPFTCPLDHLIP